VEGIGQQARMSRTGIIAIIHWTGFNSISFESGIGQKEPKEGCMGGYRPGSSAGNTKNKVIIRDYNQNTVKQRPETHIQPHDEKPSQTPVAKAVKPDKGKGAQGGYGENRRTNEKYYSKHNLPS
jgi:hypothetical protein